jgi:thiamine biosynthesis lipoprotein
MGTYYKIVIYSHKESITSCLKQKIEVQLKIINQQMSLYSKSSEITKFNKADKNKTINISNDFYKVMTQAQKLYNLTDGAWDGTIRPLYELWSFDKSKKPDQKIPDSKDIDKWLKRTGFNKIIITDKTLTKKVSFLSLDLGSIAKGYGVDAIADLLKNFDFKTFFVEIGGEVYVAGLKNHKKKWNIGISNPNADNNINPYKVITLSDKAIATSGTYINYFEHKGKTYSHIINPKTGWPVNSSILSVTVIAENCMLADGLATGLMVMERQKGIDLVQSLENVECMIVIKQANEELKPFFTNGFKKYLHK